MVDYNIAIPQQQLFQAPDFTQNAMRMQQLQAQNMQMQQSQRTQQQQNALAELMGSGIDMNSPEFRQKAFAVGGLSAVPYAQAAAAMRKEDTASRAEEARAGRYASQARTSDFDLQVNKRKDFLNRAPAAMVSDEAWAKYYEDSVKEFGPNIALSKTRPSEKDLIGFLSSASDKIRQAEAEAKAAQEAGQFTVQMTPAGPIKVNKLGQFGMATELPRDGAPVAGAAAPAVGNAPVARAAAPVAGGEAGYLTGLNRAEGTTKNPYSSADGKFQFIDSTFVDTARKAYPVLADKSPAEILTLRGHKLPDGRQIEDVLEKVLRANNTQDLTTAGIVPTPGNTYLAHFLGAGGARSLLSVDPNTPVSQILDPRAIAANKSVLEGKTAGQVAAWADSKFGGSPGLAASMTAGNLRQGGVTAFNATPAMGGGMSPTAPTVNNAMTLSLMGQQPPQQGNALAMQPAPMLQQPSVPVTTAPAQAAPAPSTYEEALRAARQRTLQQEGEKKRQDLEIVQQERIQANLPQIEDAASQTLKNIEGLIGGAQVDAKGRIVYAKDAKRAHPGFSDAVGFTFSKMLTNAPIAGTSRADFEKRLDQVKGGTFLDAYNMLRGGGAIDQKEGQKATAALNRMDLAQSEVEFVRAARDFEEIVKKGVARARTMAQGGAGSNMTSAATAAATAPGTEGAGRGISKAEYDALPSGSVYTAPNGEQRTKR